MDFIFFKFYIDDVELEIANQLSYQRLNFYPSGYFSNSQTTLADQAQKAILSLIVIYTEPQKKRNTFRF